jgi:hypothetical protein
MKIAILLRGGVSKISGRHLGVINSDDAKDDFLNILCCFNSFKKHILDVNPSITIDVYIHTWSVDLIDLLKKLYSPIRIVGEVNQIYEKDILERVELSIKSRIRSKIKSRIANFFGLYKRDSLDIAGDFAGISQSLAIKKSIELTLESEDKAEKYDAFFLYRPDLLLLKDLYFHKYSLEEITCNFMGNDQGDFHFFVPRKYVENFSNLYNSPYYGNFHDVHHWIKRYVKEFMGVKFISDDIRAGHDQEVLRKIRTSGIPFERAAEYGLDVSDWERLPF